MGLRKGVSAWLADLGMADYVQLFLDEGFDDLEVVAEMDVPVRRLVFFLSTCLIASCTSSFSPSPL